MKTSFERPVAHIGASVPIYKGARPYSCVRPPESGYPVPFSLLHAVSLPVCSLASAYELRPFCVKGVSN